MSDENVGLGWLPVEAREELEDSQARASAEEADRLLALPPRARLLDLLARAASREAEAAAAPKLTPADLRRVIGSYPGEELPDAEELATRLPGLAGPPG
jgi:hypothetical protein